MSGVLDIFIEPAVQEFVEYQNPDPLIKLIEEKSRQLLECDMARDLFIALLKGENVRGRGKKTPNTERDKRICNAIAYLKGRGYSIYDRTKESESACGFVAKISHLNAEHIYKKIWTPAIKRRKEPIPYPTTLEHCKSPKYPSMSTMSYEYMGENGSPDNDELMIRIILEKVDTK